MFSCLHAWLCIQPQLLGKTLLRAPFPKCPMLRAVPSSTAAGCARMPSWIPPVSGLLPDLTVSIHTSPQPSLGSWMGYGEVQAVAEE